MKKLTLIIFMTMTIIILFPSQMRAGTEASQPLVAESNLTGSEEASVLLSRLYAISEKDKSDLSLAEKREMRSEVKSIRDELKKVDGGVYLSAGAIIIILLILIILL